MMGVILSDLSAVALAKAEAKELACEGQMFRPRSCFRKKARGLNLTTHQNTCDEPVGNRNGIYDLCFLSDND